MNITVAELKEKLDAQEPLTVVDVREEDEWNFCRLPSACWIPLSQFQQRAPQELKTDATLVLYCHHGMRSASAQRFLQGLGYTQVWNLNGGIDAWAMQIDRQMPRY